MTDARTIELVLSGGIERAAVISPCGKYRYRLWRKWAASERMPVLWVMLNPSTADANVDDPTIKRCMAFSQRWGYGAMWVGNLFAYRSTDPDAMLKLHRDEAQGPDNRKHLYAMASQSALTVAAWGNPGAGGVGDDGDYTSPGGLWCIGTTNSGAPKHPLARGKHRVPDDAHLEEWCKWGVAA